MGGSEEQGGVAPPAGGAAATPAAPPAEGAAAAPAATPTPAPAPTPTEPTPAEREADELERLLCAGDFREARRRAEALLARSPGPGDAVAARARAVLDGVRADPWALVALAACVAFFVVVLWLTL